MIILMQSSSTILYPIAEIFPLRKWCQNCFWVFWQIRHAHIPKQVHPSQRTKNKWSHQRKHALCAGLNTRHFGVLINPSWKENESRKKYLLILPHRASPKLPWLALSPVWCAVKERNNFSDSHRHSGNLTEHGPPMFFQHDATESGSRLKTLDLNLLNVVLLVAARLFSPLDILALIRFVTAIL